jgi:preprotein translocase SecE subunit
VLETGGGPPAARMPGLATAMKETKPMADDPKSLSKADPREVRSSKGGRDRDDGRDDAHEERDDRGQRHPPAPTGVGGGFFHLYKPGQGYWTRLGTALAVALLLAFISQWAYRTLRHQLKVDDVRNAAGQLVPAGFPVWSVSVTAAITAGLALLAWHYMNKPTVVDFLIATESEMKKVNWTSRKELFGSTRVVIVFMFMISMVLFVFDLFFGYFFYLIGVLHTPPF